MTKEPARKFTVITNTDMDEKSVNSIKSPIRDNNNTNSDSGYQTNPMYERLLNFSELQKKKRFTVDDLLKW